MVKNASFVGRPYVKASYAKDPGLHKNSADPNSTRKVKSHLQYIAFRSREQDRDSETYGLFDKNSDNSSLDKFYQKIVDDPALKHSNTIKLHKLIIGFHREWFDRYNMEYKELTRHIMKGIEERKGVKLDWVAAEHLKENSPHVHVAIKSTGVDEAGQTKRLYLYKEDIEWVKEEIDRYTGRDQFIEQDRALGRDDGFDRDLFKQIGNTLERMAKEGERETQQAKNEAERKAEREERAKQNERDRGR